MRLVTIVATSAPFAELGHLLAGPNLQVRIVERAELALAAQLVRSTDVFVIDLSALDGAAFIRSVSALKPHVPVLAAARPDHPDRLAVLEAGAAGLLRLPMDKLEMVSAIYAVLRAPSPETALAADILETMPAKVALFDGDGRPLYLNPAAADFWQVEPGADFGRLFPRDLAELAAVEDEDRAKGISLAGVSGSPVSHRLLRGKLSGVAGANVVVAIAQEDAEDPPSLRHGPDAYSRRFLATMRTFLADGAATRRVCGLHLLHVEGLAPINQDYGLIVGDRLMEAIEARVNEAKRGVNGHVARIAGNEFALLHYVDGPDHLASAAANLMSVCNEPVLFAGERLLPRLKLGAAQTLATDDAERLYRAAAKALLQARAQGHDGAIVTAEAAASQSATQDAPVAETLHAAIKADALDLSYQPMVELSSGRWSALEVLLRWRRDDRGDVAPRDILAMAEDEHLLGELTSWAAGRLAADAALMSEADLPPLRFIMHLSRGQVLLEDLPARLAALTPLAQAGRVELLLPPAAFSDPAGAAMLDVVVGSGFRCAVRLSRIEPELPETFTTAMRVKVDAPDVEVLNRQILLARLKGLQVMGGNVEEATQLVRLRELGFETAQGYYIQAPLDFSALIALFRAGEP